MGANCDNPNTSKQQLCAISYLSDPTGSRAVTLTELVTDALVLQQRGVLKRIPAVQDPRVAAQRGDAAQRQHRVVDEQGGRLLPEPRQHRAVAAILGVTEDQHFARVILRTCSNTENTQDIFNGPAKIPQLSLMFSELYVEIEK